MVIEVRPARESRGTGFFFRKQIHIFYLKGIGILFQRNPC